jgi:hypothetical protein
MVEMPVEECFRILELSPASGPRAVKRAFRRLAKQHHPDLQQDPSAPAHFTRVVQAYTTLQREFRAQASESDARLCPSCGKLSEMFESLDGGVQCADCLLGVSRRRLLLPASPIQIVKHGSVIVMELVALGLFAAGFAYESRWMLIASMVLSVAALGVLAIVCANVRNVR